MSTRILEIAEPSSLTLASGAVLLPEMGTFGETIKRLRESRGWTQEVLAMHAEASTKSISIWEGLASPTIQGIKLFNLAKAFGMSVDDLKREWRKPAIQQSIGDPVRRGIPVINKAPAGTVVDFRECSMADSGQGSWYVSREGIDDPNAFAVVVTGDSMTPFLPDGGIAIFSPMDMDGHIRHDRRKVPEDHVLFVRFGPDAPEDGCCIARWSMKGGKVKLTKDNKKYKSITCEPEWIVRMAALISHDDFPGVRKTFAANQQLDSKGEMDTQVEGQVHPDY